MIQYNHSKVHAIDQSVYEDRYFIGSKLTYRQWRVSNYNSAIHTKATTQMIYQMKRCHHYNIYACVNSPRRLQKRDVTIIVNQ